MTATLTSGVLSDMVASFYVHYKTGYEQIEQNALGSGIFEIDPLERNMGEDREYSEIDSDDFLDITSPGDKTPTLLSQQGYTKRLVYYERKGMVSITDTFERRNKYPEIKAKLVAIGSNVAKTREIDLSHRLTYANATSYTSRSGRTIDTSAPDGFAMCYSAHTLPGTSTTYRNRLTGDPLLTAGTLEQAERLADNEIINNQGQKQTVPFTVLITTKDPTTSNTAREILQSTAKISAPNEGVLNVNEGKYRHVQMPYINTSATGAPDSTKRAYWFLATDVYPFHPFVYSEEVGEKHSAWEDKDTDTTYYKVFTSYGIVGKQPRGLIGSFPTSS